MDEEKGVCDCGDVAGGLADRLDRVFGCWIALPPRFPAPSSTKAESDCFRPPDGTPRRGPKKRGPRGLGSRNRLTQPRAVSGSPGSARQGPRPPASGSRRMGEPGLWLLGPGGPGGRPGCCPGQPALTSRGSLYSSSAKFRPGVGNSRPLPIAPAPHSRSVPVPQTNERARRAGLDSERRELGAIRERHRSRRGLQG